MNPTDKLSSDLGQALFLVWGFPQGAHRSQFIAQELGMEVAHVYLTARQGLWIALLKYPVQAIKTLMLLARRRPRVVFIQDPPIFAILMVYLWGLLTGTKYIIDSHTDALLAPWWAWSLPLHGFLSRRAITNLVTNEHLRRIVTDWGADALILRDVPATHPERRPLQLDNDCLNVALVSTASYDEPITEMLQAASSLPDVQFHITGNHHKRPQVVQSAPPNVRFTGYLPDEDFYGLLESVQVVMCLTKENHTMQSGATEGLWLGKPVITSDWPLLREYFHQGALHADNTVEGIRQAVIGMRDNLPALQAGILALQVERRAEWQQKIKILLDQIDSVA